MRLDTMTLYDYNGSYRHMRPIFQEEVVIVELKEIPEGGSEYHFNRESKEFNQVLEPVLGKAPYDINLKIQPNGTLFKVNGRAKAKIPLSCSRCLRPFSMPVDAEINEFLVLASELPRTGKEAKVNHTSELLEDGPTTTLIKDLHFDLSPLIHDVLSLSAPSHAICKTGCRGLCGSCGADLNRSLCQCSVDKHSGHPGFAKLKELKLN